MFNETYEQKKERSNIKSPRLEPLDWGEGERVQSMEKVIDFVCQRAEVAVNWYLGKKDQKRTFAMWMRAGAIILAVVGGALPALSDALADQMPGVKSLSTSWAYVALTVSAGLIALDRFFGFSSSWMRFLSTQMTIQHRLSEFLWKIQMHRVEWGGQRPSEAQVTQVLEHCNEFATQVRDILKNEMELWKQEFQSALKDVEAAAKAQSEALQTQIRETRTGGLTVTVTNGEQTNHDWSVAIDDQILGAYSGKRTALTGIAPGLRRVTVTGSIGAKAVRDSVALVIVGGSANHAELTLS